MTKLSKAERKKLLQSLRMVEKHTGADPQSCLQALNEAENDVDVAVNLLLNKGATALSERTEVNKRDCFKAVKKARGDQAEALLFLWANEIIPITSDNQLTYNDQILEARVQLVLNGRLRLTTLATPVALHLFAWNYNWDNGLKPLNYVINQEFCDRGTALLIYWRAQPYFYYQYSSRQEVPRFDRKEYDLINEIERKYLGGFYEQNNIAFDPADDGGNDLTQKARTANLTRPIPKGMFEPIAGEIVKWAVLEA